MLLPVLLLVRPVPALLLVLLEIIMYKRMVEFCNDYNILSPFNLFLQRNGQQNQLCSVFTHDDFCVYDSNEFLLSVFSIQLIIKSFR